MKSIPFFDLTAQNKNLQKELDGVWKRTIQSNEFILGNELERFEKNVSKFIGTRFAIGVSSGLDALFLSLKALGVGEGDEVIVPANSFIATALAVSSAGARPVFSDVSPETLLMDLKNVQKVLSPKTKAVIPVHLFGQPVEIEPIIHFCKAKKIYVIEDACQAHGAAIGKKRCGSFGILGCFSFYPGKNLGAFGDGGLVTIDDPTLAENLRLLRNYGSVEKYRHLVKGFNMRLDSLQAGILNVKLRHLKKWNEKRNTIARHYSKRLAGIPEVWFPKEQKGHFNVYHLFVICVKERDRLKEFLLKRGIGTNIHYPVPIHLQAAYQYLWHKEGDFPVSEKSASEILSLPLYPEMSFKGVDCVCDAIRDFF